KTRESEGYEATLTATWNSLFSFIAPTLLNEAREADMRNSIRRFLLDLGRKQLQSGDPEDTTLRNWQFEAEEINTAIIQLRALGLISESQRKRSVTDTQKY